ATAAKPPLTPALPDEDDNAEEPAPLPEPPPPREAANEAAPRAPMLQIKTEPLADDFEPQDPSAPTGVYTFVPVRHPIKLPDAPQDSPRATPATIAQAPEATPTSGADGSGAAGATGDPAGETTGAGRMATLPPESPRPPEAPAPAVAHAPVSAPAVAPAPAPAQDEAVPSERRQSIEFANRSTLPWRPKQAAGVRAAVASPTPAPTHQ